MVPAGVAPVGELSAQPALGKYQLIRRLATGGMAELFLARAQGAHGFEKFVVLKRILPQHAESEDFIRMFLTEARLAATLHHPNIVQVYDIGEDGGAHFFTMEYVQGQDLRRIVKAARRHQKPIPLEHILHMIVGMAAGLHHAHEKVGMDGRPLGIVHRDVSPSNVLVTYEGDVKIVDFGIAKAATAQVCTIAGTLKGKIPYMSPEQCRGESVDRRSDIFSIGTLLWELTTGKRLFAGDNEFTILNRVAKGDVPLPSAIRPDYPPELEAIVMRALQAEPDHRYAAAQELQLDLEDFIREARLPVSSARMGKFMHELFEEEIRLQSDEVAQDGPAPSRVGGDALTVHVTASEPELGEYTPSELRQHQFPTGGGLVEVTRAGLNTPLDEVPGAMRRGPLIALFLGAMAGIAVLGLSQLGMNRLASWGSTASSDESSVREEAPKRIIPEVPVREHERGTSSAASVRETNAPAVRILGEDAKPPIASEEGSGPDAPPAGKAEDDPLKPDETRPDPRTSHAQTPVRDATRPATEVKRSPPRKTPKKPQKDEPAKTRDINALLPFD